MQLNCIKMNTDVVVITVFWIKVFSVTWQWNSKRNESHFTRNNVNTSKELTMNRSEICTKVKILTVLSSLRVSCKRAIWIFSIFLTCLNRRSRPEVLCKKGVLWNFAKFTGKHLHQSLFFKWYQIYQILLKCSKIYDGLKNQCVQGIKNRSLVIH